MKRVYIFVASVLVVGFGVWKWQSQRSNWQIAMEKSPTLSIYSLLPLSGFDFDEMSPAQFKALESRGSIGGGYILDKATISDVDDKKQLLEALKSSLAGSRYEDSASCFNPRHAIGTADGKTTISICFECGNGQIKDGGKNKMVGSNNSGKPVFDGLWRKYRLKLSLNRKP